MRKRKPRVKIGPYHTQAMEVKPHNWHWDVGQGKWSYSDDDGMLCVELDGLMVLMGYHDELDWAICYSWGASLANFGLRPGMDGLEKVSPDKKGVDDATANEKPLVDDAPLAATFDAPGGGECERATTQSELFAPKVWGGGGPYRPGP